MSFAMFLLLFSIAKILNEHAVVRNVLSTYFLKDFIKLKLFLKVNSLTFTTFVINLAMEGLCDKYGDQVIQQLNQTEELKTLLS
jgi:hypothetical protein